jgi:hypothetical protein
VDVSHWISGRLKAVSYVVEMWFSSWLNFLIEFVGGVAPEELATEFVKTCFGGDADELDLRDLGEVFEVLKGEGLAEAGVVGAAGVDPGGGGNLQVGSGDPDGSGYGELR